jgi:hypothetical protein
MILSVPAKGIKMSQRKLLRAVSLVVLVGCSTVTWESKTTALGTTSPNSGIERIKQEQPDSVRLVFGGGRGFTRVLHQPTVRGDSSVRGYRHQTADTLVTYSLSDINAIQFATVRSSTKNSLAIVGGVVLVGYMVWLATLDWW